MTSRITCHEAAARHAIEIAHTAALLTLPFHHNDPFDRLLVAQAVVEGIPIVSADVALSAYAVTRVW